MDYFDASDRIRSHDDIAHEHACHNEIDDGTLSLPMLVTALIGIAVLHWLLWWVAK